MRIIVNPNKCPQDHACPASPVCPVGAISQQNLQALPDVDQKTCLLCGAYQTFCPKGAFEKTE